jgi:hypothetical protein
MKKYLLPIFLLLLFAPAAFAQNTTISGTFTDANSQALAYGSWTIKFSPSPSSPSGPYSWNGSPFNIQTSYTGTLNGSGALTAFSIQSTNFITPTGNSWTLTVCPAATVNCSSGNVIITGSTQSLSSAITIPAIQVQANTSNQAAAYSDAEIQGAIPGYVYWNITSSTLRVCAGPLPCTWTAVGGGGGGGVTSLNGLTGAVVLAAGTNITLTPSGNTITIASSGGGASCTGTSGELLWLSGTSCVGLAGSSANAAGNVTLAPPATGVGLTVTGAPDNSDGLDVSGAFESQGGIVVNSTDNGSKAEPGIVSNTLASDAVIGNMTCSANCDSNAGIGGVAEATDNSGGAYPFYGGIFQAQLIGTNGDGDLAYGVYSTATESISGGTPAELTGGFFEAMGSGAPSLVTGVHIGVVSGGAATRGLLVDSQSGNPAIVTATTDPTTLGLLTAATITDSGLTAGACEQPTTGGLLASAAGPCAIAINLATGTPTFTAGTNVTSVACASGYTCTNERGELTIVGGTATTGTIATVNFSATLSAAPGLCIVTQEGGATLFGIGHGTPSTSSFTITSGVSVAASTLAVDYICRP